MGPLSWCRLLVLVIVVIMGLAGGGGVFAQGATASTAPPDVAEERAQAQRLLSRLAGVVRDVTDVRDIARMAQARSFFDQAGRSQPAEASRLLRQCIRICREVIEKVSQDGAAVTPASPSQAIQEEARRARAEAETALRNAGRLLRTAGPAWQGRQSYNLAENYWRQGERATEASRFGHALRAYQLSRQFSQKASSAGQPGSSEDSAAQRSVLATEDMIARARPLVLSSRNAVARQLLERSREFLDRAKAALRGGRTQEALENSRLGQSLLKRALGILRSERR